MEPPKSVFVEVGVLQDKGEIQLSTGSVILEVGTRHLLAHNEVEHLIRFEFPSTDYLFISLL
jgi:hypothetical protein